MPNWLHGYRFGYKNSRIPQQYHTLSPKSQLWPRKKDGPLEINKTHATPGAPRGLSNFCQGAISKHWPQLATWLHSRQGGDIAGESFLQFETPTGHRLATTGHSWLVRP